MGDYEVFVSFRKFVSVDSWTGRACHSLPHLASPPIRKPAQTQTLGARRDELKSMIV